MNRNGPELKQVVHTRAISVSAWPFLELFLLSKDMFNILWTKQPRNSHGDTSPGGGVLPYMGHVGLCRCEGYGFQAVYSSLGYVNQSVWV